MKSPKSKVQITNDHSIRHLPAGRQAGILILGFYYIMISMKFRKLKNDTIVLHIGNNPPLSLKSAFNWKEFLWDKAQFIVLSAFVFVIFYGLLNYQAIFENLRFKIQTFSQDGGQQTEIFEQAKPDTKPAQASVLQASILNTKIAEKSSTQPIPKLSASVYPPDTRIIIPRILKNVPVVGVNNENLIARKWEELEKDIQQSLKSGVVHYPGTALPGEIGNAVFTGHSSYYAWDAGRFKDVFALLHEVKTGDKVFIFHNQKKFIYEIFDIRVVLPSEIDVLGKTNDERITLITCTPLGTNLKRLVVTGKRVG